MRDTFTSCSHCLLSRKISGLSSSVMCLFFLLFVCLLVVAGEGLVGGVGVVGLDVDEGVGDDGPGVDEGGGGRAGLGTSAVDGRLQFLQFGGGLLVKKNFNSPLPPLHNFNEEKL